MTATATSPHPAAGPQAVPPVKPVSLHPNHARLALLQDVDDGLVVYAPGQGGVLNLATQPPRSVVSETAEMREVGWISVDIREGADTLGSYPYALTDTGRAVLEGGVQSAPVFPAAAPPAADEHPVACPCLPCTDALLVRLARPLTAPGPLADPALTADAGR